MPNEKQWFYRKFRHVTNAENWKKGTVEYQLTDWLNKNQITPDSCKILSSDDERRTILIMYFAEKEIKD